MSTTLVANATTLIPVLPVLCVAIELSMKRWKIGILGRTDRNPSVHEMGADDWTALMGFIARAKDRLGYSSETRVLACFESGRHGHYVHRKLKSLGVGSAQSFPN